MKWLTAIEITKWAETDGRRCQETLPEVISRLILATAPSVQRIDFPCGNSVTTGGWDGHLETVSQSPFFPDGTSKWEIGSEKSPGKKADADSESRNKNALSAVPKDTTYVAVTSRTWTKRDEWERKKKAEKHWKDVRAIGADGLELWLASAPAVALWFARLIGKVTHGIRDIEALWSEWSISTNPAFTPDIVIAGRTKERDEIHQWLARPAGILEMQGDSPDEPFAFLYASIATLPDQDRAKALSRCIVVENLQQLRDCYQSFSNSLIIAAPAECYEAANAAVAKGHHVFLSMDAKTIDIGRILRLMRPQREALQKALQDAGLSEADAHKQLRDSGRSIPVLRRRLFRSGLVKAPAWAETSAAATLLPALLAGAWNEEKEGDKEMIEALSGVSYKDFLKKLASVASVDDAPVRKVGNVWTLKSPLDAWFLVARHLDAEHFDRFRKAVNAVLTETNPKYDLPPDKRWAAGVYGKNAKYSEWIRRGLVESLVLLAVYGERISSAIDGPQNFADLVVRDVLDGADTWQAWASIKDIMSLLSEAAPDAFLDALEEKIEAHTDLFKDLMRDEDSRYGLGDCQHSGLLWALESIAWHPQYVIRAARALFLLAKLDHGGRWSNRPLASLTEVLLPGIPQTHATPELRLAIFDMIIEQDPGIAWKIAERHMDSITISASHRFRWRDSGGDRAPLDGELRSEHAKYGKGLLPRWAGLACANNENLTAAVEHFLRLEEPVRDQVLETLKNVKSSSFSKEERRVILHNLRHTLNWINNYDSDKKYTPYAPILKKAYEALAPTDTLERVDWLFADGWPQLPEEPQASKDHEQGLVAARKAAARDLLDNLALDKVLDYGETLNYPAIFSSSLAKTVKTKKEDSMLVDALAKRVPKHPWLLVGYSMGRIEDVGDKWVSEEVDRLKKKKEFSPEAIAALFRGMSEGGPTWGSVASQGAEVEEAYWKLASGYSRSGDENKVQDSTTAVEKLLSVGRVESAINIAGDSHISLPSTLLQRVLIDLLKVDGEKKKRLNGTMLEFYLTNIFNQLYERKELSLDEIGKLEWPYAQVFDRFNRGTAAPLALHRTLQKDPAFFVDLMSHQYKKDDGTLWRTEGLTEEQAANIATNAREVLDSWHLVPGVNEDGSIDEKALNTWVDDARKIAKSKSFLKGCDLKLAEILSRMPSDKDGMWPHIALRNMIERIKSSLIDDHIPYAIYNSRGVRSRGVFEGGQKEREMAETYKQWSRKMRGKWPRTAKMIASLGNMLDRDAKREDVDSELRDLEF